MLVQWCEIFALKAILKPHQVCENGITKFTRGKISQSKHAISFLCCHFIKQLHLSPYLEADWQVGKDSTFIHLSYKPLEVGV